jgi:predicted permease
MQISRWKPTFSWLDVKLGLRLMRKHLGVSLAIVLALAIGIPASLLPGHVIGAVLGQSPPFDEGERVVGVVGVGQDGRAGLHVGDYETLRERTSGFSSLGAVIPTTVNVVSGDGWSEGEDAALMTASAFALTRVQPMSGRVLLPADEIPGAPDVAVVGDAFWRRRLAAAANVVGTTIRIAGVPTTIVGVMPQGFAMPSTQQLWLPLRSRSASYADRLGPAVSIYGRLGDGVSITRVRAELRAISLPAIAGTRATAIRPDVVAFSTVDIQEPEGGVMWLLLLVAQVVPVIILLIACGNAAILILARAASRRGEMAVRTVLGASRARIMGQLFAETLVLALLATGIGVAAIAFGIARVLPQFPLPFWFDPSITPVFALKALGVSVLCAIVAGVLPAWRATGRALQPMLLSTAGSGTLRLGRLAAALTVLEVGLATVALFAGIMAWRIFQPNPDIDTRIADADRYLVASIRVAPSGVIVATDRPASEDQALRVRVAALQEEIGRRLTLQPGVRRWTFSDQPPGEEALERLVRMDRPAGPDAAGVATFVDLSFFSVLDVSPRAGRLFDGRDLSRDPAVEPTAVLVNMKFLERRGLHPQGALGMRFRFVDGRTDTVAPWKEIVGVVPNIEPSADRVFADGTPVVFMPAAPGTINPMTVTVDLGKSPLAFARTLRSLIAEIDPAAFVGEVHALDDLPSPVSIVAVATSVMGGLSLLAMILATTALYALMSMTVTQRRREFGIRLALGGTAAGVMITVARRALLQIGMGLAWGAGLWVVLMSTVLTATPGSEAAKMRGPWPYVLAVAVMVVAVVALAAALGPTLRYVRMRPVETLRAEG